MSDIFLLSKYLSKAGKNVILLRLFLKTNDQYTLNWFNSIMKYIHQWMSSLKCFRGIIWQKKIKNVELQKDAGYKLYS